MYDQRKQFLFTDTQTYILWYNKYGVHNVKVKAARVFTVVNIPFNTGMPNDVYWTKIIHPYFIVFKVGVDDS